MLVVPAPAKINLALEVVRRRPDGWHDIESVVVPIDWHDLIGLELRDAAHDVRVSGPASEGVPGALGAPPAADNLAVRAADALTATAAGNGDAGDAMPRPLRVWVHKRVPAGAGLGGGSADAAAVLRAASRLTRQAGAGLGSTQISALAALLGSDVPALLARTTVHVTGRGERLAEIDAPPLHLVIAFLGPSSTRDAYEALRPEEMSDGSRVRALIAALTGVSAETGGEPINLPPPADGLLGSALEAPALRLIAPLAVSAQRLRDSTAPRSWHMTGSGGAFFAMARDAVDAAALAQQVREEGLLARACRTLSASPLRPDISR
ncbi:MAG: hypothetical protein JOZ75_04565 [Candidatus Dormibacteraeota bacterium]|nr:hypothetical protein [Candidatus Dormibacteraeota bacterium]